MNDFLFLLKEVASRKSLLRATLNYRLKEEFLEGRILDLGSGGDDRYSTFIPRSKDSVYELFDVKKGEVQVDFESDRLPYETGTYDTILLLNVLEHIFNYSHLLTEVKRIKKSDGVLVGYVPFLHWYHADPHDYFRYTHESLEKILKNAGYTEVTIEKIYRGPYTTAFQMIHPTLPVFLRPFIFAPLYACDVLFKKLRPKGAKRYVFGYYFRAK